MYTFLGRKKQRSRKQYSVDRILAEAISAFDFFQYVIHIILEVSRNISPKLCGQILIPFCPLFILQLTSQIITYEHEGNWSKALEYYDLQVRSEPMVQTSSSTSSALENSLQAAHPSSSRIEDEIVHKKPYKGLIRSLQQIGCTHVLDVYCQGLTSQKGQFQRDLEFTELQVW